MENKKWIREEVEQNKNKLLQELQQEPFNTSGENLDWVTKEKYCSEIEKEFKFIGGDEVVFNNPFVVHISVGNFHFTENERYVITGIVGGRELTYETESGVKYQVLEVRDLEDLMDLAHLLDELQTNNIKIIKYE